MLVVASGSNEFRSFHTASQFLSVHGIRTRKALPWTNPNTLGTMDLFLSLFPLKNMIRY